MKPGSYGRLSDLLLGLIGGGMLSAFATAVSVPSDAGQVVMAGVAIVGAAFVIISQRKIWPALVLIAVLSATFGIAHADVPTLADVGACIDEARGAVRGRTASPTATDEARAQDVGRGHDGIVSRRPRGGPERPRRAPRRARAPARRIRRACAGGAPAGSLRDLAPLWSV